MSERDCHEIIYQYMMQDASVFFMHLDCRGTILSVNSYAEKLIGSGFSHGKANLFDVVVNFGHVPSIIELFSLNDKPRLLNISTQSGLPQSFYFKFFPLNDDFLMIGQQDSEEVENLRVNLISAVNEANNLSRELQKKNVQLTRLNGLKNQFMGMAAHDLRNPLAIILVYSEFLFEDTKNVLSDKSASLILKIKNSSKFMLNLLNDLLDVSKIESGNLGLRLELTDIQPLIQDYIDLNQVIASTKKIELRYHRNDNLPQVNIDPPRIEQVLNNLLSNAVKYSMCETVVNVDIVHRDAHVVVAVRDQGQGIPPEELQRIFQPFQTVAIKGTAGEKSTGLGLVIAQKIVTAHGGELWVESSVGNGTSFFFSLPAAGKTAAQQTISSERVSEYQQDKKESESYFWPLLNASVIKEYKALDHDFFKELLEMFFAETPVLIEEIKALIAKKNLDQLKLSLAQLRGSCSSIGASSLSGLCDSLLNFPDEELLSSAFDFLEQFGSMYEQTKQALIAVQNIQ